MHGKRETIRHYFGRALLRVGIYTMNTADRTNAIWQQYRERLHGYIAKRVHETGAADDILQDVFLKVHTHLNTLRSQDRMVSWLYRVASNAVYDYYRTQRPWEEIPEELAAPEPEADVIAELSECVKPFIEGLPERYRTALVQSELEGVSQKEVAARMNLSHSGAKSLVQRGREKLRVLLMDCCDIESGPHGVVGYEPRNRNCQCGG